MPPTHATGHLRAARGPTGNNPPAAAVALNVTISQSAATEHHMHGYLVDDITEADLALRLARSRAQSLRALAEDVDPVTATAFRRRAAELEVAAWSVAARMGDRRPVDRHLPATTTPTAPRRRSARAA